MTALPPQEVFQYFAHLFHGQTLIPYNEYQPMPDWNYPEVERRRFETLFLTDNTYLDDKRILDLGCHTGFLSYLALEQGACSVEGFNARSETLNIGQYAFESLGVDKSKYKFTIGNIEDSTALATACNNKDTVVLVGVLEHLQNPYAILDTISRSAVTHLIFETTVFEDTSWNMPGLRYNLQNVSSAFTAYADDNAKAWAAVPNTMWIESMLYHMGWKIEFYQLDHVFNKEWFAVPDLKDTFRPSTHKKVSILATKFQQSGTKNWIE
jgi:SAM-dependent methyltransferase